jgi:hypothetical protein
MLVVAAIVLPLCALAAQGQEPPEPEVANRISAGLGYAYGGQFGLTYEHANRIVAGVAGVGLTEGQFGAVIGARVYRDTGRRVFLEVLFGPITRLRDDLGRDVGSFDGVMLDAGWSTQLNSSLRFVTSLGVGVNPSMRNSPIGRPTVLIASVGVSWRLETWAARRE